MTNAVLDGALVDLRGLVAEWYADDRNKTIDQAQQIIELFMYLDHAISTCGLVPEDWKKPKQETAC